MLLYSFISSIVINSERVIIGTPLNIDLLLKQILHWTNWKGVINSASKLKWENAVPCLAEHHDSFIGHDAPKTCSKDTSAIFHQDYLGSN